MSKGAVSSAVIAFIAELTREENRTKTRTMVGSSICVSFAAVIVDVPIFHSFTQSARAAFHGD